MFAKVIFGLYKDVYHGVVRHYLPFLLLQPGFGYRLCVAGHSQETLYVLLMAAAVAALPSPYLVQTITQTILIVFSPHLVTMLIGIISSSITSQIVQVTS